MSNLKKKYSVVINLFLGAAAVFIIATPMLGIANIYNIDLYSNPIIKVVLLISFFVLSTSLIVLGVLGLKTDTFVTLRFPSSPTNKGELLFTIYKTFKVYKDTKSNIYYQCMHLIRKGFVLIGFLLLMIITIFKS